MRVWSVILMSFMIYFRSVPVMSYKVIVGDCTVIYDEPCSELDIQFYLYSTTDSNVEIIAIDPFEPILPADFNSSLPMKIVIHGYGGLPVDKAIKNVTQAYKDMNYNMILVDWSTLAAVPCYPAAFLNTWHVGQCTAILSVSLAKLGVSIKQTHIIGFSLGAHIASFASNHLKKTLGTNYHRITGLDPALPLFATSHHEWKLDKSDAPFVDVIHTNAGSFGKLEAIGHIDFYVNGGVTQPLCEKDIYPPLCSHMMAGYYFAKTIQNRKYYGIECPSLIHYNLGFCKFDLFKKQELMGEYVNQKAKGVYFVDIPSETSVVTKYDWLDYD